MTADDPPCDCTHQPRMRDADGRCFTCGGAFPAHPSHSARGDEDMFMVRQGDVLIVETTGEPAGEPLAPVGGRVVLAHGEATGHHHSIAANGGRALLFQMPDDMLLKVSSGPAVTLEHQEHAAIAIPPGTYRVIRQREYTPEAIRNVAD